MIRKISDLFCPLKGKIENRGRKIFGRDGGFLNVSQWQRMTLFGTITAVHTVLSHLQSCHAQESHYTMELKHGRGMPSNLLYSLTCALEEKMGGREREESEGGVRVAGKGRRKKDEEDVGREGVVQ
jgi:hypothetical protein